MPFKFSRTKHLQVQLWCLIYYWSKFSDSWEVNCTFINHWCCPDVLDNLVIIFSVSNVHFTFKWLLIPIIPIIVLFCLWLLLVIYVLLFIWIAILLIINILIILVVKSPIVVVINHVRVYKFVILVDVRVIAAHVDSLVSHFILLSDVLYNLILN